MYYQFKFVLIRVGPLVDFLDKTQAVQLWLATSELLVVPLQYGQLLTWTLVHQANEKVDTCSPLNF